MPSTPSQGVALPFAAALCGIAIFSGMDAVMKHLALEIGAYNAMLWRTMLSLVVLLPIWFARGGKWPTRRVWALHLVRNVTFAFSLILFFWALKRVPMAEGIALTFISPLVALGLAALFLKERVGRSAIGASLLAFGGVLVILLTQPEGSGAARGDWTSHGAILLAAVLYAVGLVVGRPLSQRASPLEVATFFNIIAGAMFAAAAPFAGAIPEARHLPALVLATLCANLSIMAMAWAYARAEAQVLLPVEYTAFLWAMLFGWLIFGEVVTAGTLAGAALIVAACVWAARTQPRPMAVEAHVDPDLAAQQQERALTVVDRTRTLR